MLCVVLPRPSGRFLPLENQRLTTINNRLGYLQGAKTRYSFVLAFEHQIHNILSEIPPTKIQISFDRLYSNTICEEPIY